tara:strand:+ start:1330 stop:1887 length:558 start_codon:yes stop_codon:yes gene_type:complete
MKIITTFLICFYSSLLHAESGKYDASKIVEPTPEMLKMTSAELFKEIDRDGDGQVSFTETNEALEYSPKHTKRKFAKSDRDKSGGLNLKEFEFRLTRTEWWNLSRETPEAMFKAADANQNGTLSKKEFAVFQKKEAHLELFFTRADLNKSGDVDLKEATKYVNLEIFPSRKSKNIRKAKLKGQGQ